MLQGGSYLVTRDQEDEDVPYRRSVPGVISRQEQLTNERTVTQLRLVVNLILISVQQVAEKIVALFLLLRIPPSLNHLL